jgi:hypothetical protein
MPDATPSRDDGAPEFRSPKRALARSFRLSRDRWKLKAAQRRQQIKALQVRLRDLEASRDLWKDKALHPQAQLQPPPAAAPPQADDRSPAPATARAGPVGGQPPPGPAPKKARRALR